MNRPPPRKLFFQIVMHPRGLIEDLEYSFLFLKALRNLQFYQYDPEQDNKEIMSNIKEIEKEDNELTGDLMNETDPQGVDSRSEIKVKTENAFKSQVKVDETLLQEEKNVVKADIRSLFPENEVLKKELEPLLGYRDEYVVI